MGRGVEGAQSPGEEIANRGSPGPGPLPARCALSGLGAAAVERIALAGAPDGEVGPVVPHPSAPAAKAGPVKLPQSR